MLTRTFLRTILFVASTFAPITAMADTSLPVASDAAAEPCPLKAHRISSVSGYRVDALLGKTTVSRLRGASVYLLAEPGLTKEWLQLTLGRHVIDMRGAATMKDCPLDLDDLTISVDSAGPGFAVRLAARDGAGAEEVLRRANLLQR